MSDKKLYQMRPIIVVRCEQGSITTFGNIRTALDFYDLPDVKEEELDLPFFFKTNSYLIKNGGKEFTMTQEAHIYYCIEGKIK